MKKLILICLILVMNSVFAQQVATVLFTSKKVVANRNGTVRTLARGSALEPGDAIITAASALAKIKYANGTLVNIGENSNYKIIAYSTKPSDVQIKAQLNIGKIKFKTPGKLNETLKTPVISLAILGTEAAVYVPDNNRTYAEVSEGNVGLGKRVIGPGDSVLATSQGVKDTEFPAAGRIREDFATDVTGTPPLDRRLSESALNTTGERSRRGETLPQASANTSDAPSPSELNATASVDEFNDFKTDPVTLIETNQEVGIAASTAADAALAVEAASEAAELADISLICEIIPGLQ